MVFHSLLVCSDNLHYEKFADGGVKCIEDELRPVGLSSSWLLGVVVGFYRHFSGGF